MQYDDDFATCKRTYATLAIYKHEIDLAYVSGVLGIEPNEGQPHGTSQQKTPGSGVSKAGTRGWFLTSKGNVQSRDLRRHIDWVTERLTGKVAGLRELKETGHEARIIAYWLSAYGHGGPILSSPQTQAIAQLDVDLDLDVYIADS
jgi:hypothetical protein